MSGSGTRYLTLKRGDFVVEEKSWPSARAANALSFDTFRLCTFAESPLVRGWAELRRPRLDGAGGAASTPDDRLGRPTAFTEGVGFAAAGVVKAGPRASF